MRAATSRTTRRTARPPASRKPASSSTRDLPLRDHAERALSDYLAKLNGHRPSRLYDLVLREVEEPLFRTVLDYADGNQSQAAVILGITRGTLRKKLRQFGLSA
jgi:Fis family transcriptional regulator